MTSNFDPSQILDLTTTEESVRRPPLPTGEVYTGEIADVSVRINQGKQDPSKSYTGVDVKIKFSTAHIAGQPEFVTVKDGFLLDLTEAGQLDMSAGKNGRLGRYREALGMNVAGQPFSIRQMQGRPIKATIKHKADEKDPSVLYEEVAAIAKA
jgi:hypothetical protein